MLRAFWAFALSLALGSPVLSWVAGAPAKYGGRWDPNGAPTQVGNLWDPNGAPTAAGSQEDPNGGEYGGQWDPDG
jgi:hypothetical protein